MKRTRKRRSDWEGRRNRYSVKLTDAETIALREHARRTGETYSETQRRGLMMAIESARQEVASC